MLNQDGQDWDVKPPQDAKVRGDLRIKWRHGKWRFSFAAFASLRLGENRRLNKEAHLSQRRKDAKGPPFISQKPSVGSGRQPSAGD
jgi:hypothetical protein